VSNELVGCAGKSDPCPEPVRGSRAAPGSDSNSRGALRLAAERIRDSHGHFAGNSQLHAEYSELHPKSFWKRPRAVRHGRACGLIIAGAYGLYVILPS